MRIAIIGADGQLGSDLVKFLSKHDLFLLYYPDFDITKPEDAKKILLKIHPEIIINTAAYHRVDECEDNPAMSFAVNSIAVRDLAFICRGLQSVLVHFSSDYIFNGTKNAPYIEEDTPNPLNVYGVSKLAGEFFVQNILKRYYIVRTSGLYGETGCWGKGTNFVDSMISLEEAGKAIKVVNDQTVTPTSTLELAQRIGELIETNHFGLYHLTNEGQCTWFEFAKKIFNILGRNPNLIPIDSQTYGAKAQRPFFSVLENRKAKKIKLTDFSSWEKALEDYLHRKGYKIQVSSS